LVNYHGGTSWNNIFNLLPIFRGLWMSRWRKPSAQTKHLLLHFSSYCIKGSLKHDQQGNKRKSWSARKRACFLSIPL
jgi:hypothetical protein